jgi:hypothetical protein
VCGENLFAKHSIHYSTLPTYFMGFSIWNEQNVCLSWDETIEWFTLMGITSVPVLYDGLYDEQLIRMLSKEMHWDTTEGYVVRVADPIPYRDFRHSIAKFVRKGHVQTTKHWMRGQRIERNLLVKSDR